MTNSMNKDLGLFEYLLSLDDKNFSVVGIERVGNERDLKVSMKCKNCDIEISSTLTTLKNSSEEPDVNYFYKRVTCPICGKIVYMISDSDDGVIRAFRVVGRRSFEEWLNKRKGLITNK